MMIIYIILLILVILSYLLSKKILIIANAYNELEKRHIALFNALKKREEYLLDAYKDDQALMEYYSEIHQNQDLKMRIKDEINLDSIDDNFDELTIDFKAKLQEYNDEYLKFKEIKDQYPLLYKLQNYIEYEMY